MPSRRRLVGYAGSDATSGSDTLECFPVCGGDNSRRNLGWWVKHRATDECPGCGSLRSNKLQKADLNRQQVNTASTCAACTQSRYVVPQASAIPLALQGLPSEVIFALRPCVLHQGDVHWSSAQGYRYTTEISGISWAATSVESRVRDVKEEYRDMAARALTFLENSSDRTVWRKLRAEHQGWLKRKDGKRTWGWSALFRPALECCLWPHLYPDSWADCPADQ
ncbi:unnamed protein product, partial [Prorocentrum cordatum]